MDSAVGAGARPLENRVRLEAFNKEMTMSDPKGNPQAPQGDQGQKPPSDDNAVKQRHQLGEPVKQDSVPIPSAP